MKTLDEFNELEQLKIKKVLLYNGISHFLKKNTLFEMNGSQLIKIIDNNNEFIFEDNKIIYPF